MTYEQNIPYLLKKALEKEHADFIFKSKSNVSLKGVLVFLFFMMVFIGPIVLPLIGFLIVAGIGFFHAKKVDAEIISTIMNSMEIEKLELMPIILDGVFMLLISLIVFIFIFRVFFRGSWYAFTRDKLFILNGKSLRVLNWGELTGNVKMVDNNGKGNIFLEEKMAEIKVMGKSSPSIFFKKIKMIGIDNPRHIYQIIKTRIEENKKKISKNR